MHYELYVDSLFLINFVMNLYLLMLVNHVAFHTATWGRLMTGAAVGALGFFVPLVFPGPVIVKFAAGFLIGTVGMLCITFPIKSLRMFFKLFEKLVIYSLGMGGVLLFLVRAFPGIRNALTGIFGILGVGGCGCLLLSGFGYGRGLQNSLCTATLMRDGVQLTVVALIDSGNSLMEPISGKPVCVVEKKLFQGLWQSESQGFRAIPYHSVGKRKGIMPGYLLPKLQLEVDGMELTFKDVYIAVSEEEFSDGDSAGADSVKIIIPLGLIYKGRKGKPCKRQNVRRDDSESSNAGKNAV